MKKGLMLFIVFSMIFMLVSAMIAFAVERALTPVERPQTQRALKPAMAAKPVFLSTVPSPLRLSTDKVNQFTVNQFTIKGTSLDSVTGLILANPRNPLWRLHANIVSRTSDAITATVDVPKYLALGPYDIQAAVSGAPITRTGLTAQADENKPCLVWTEFLPNIHGFNFANHNWGAVCFQIAGGRLEYKPDSPHICDNAWGLCGGMALNAGERYRSGFSGTHGLNQFAIKPDILNAQFRTLDGPTVAKIFAWISSPDQGHVTNPLHSVGYRMGQDWDGLIKPQLDAYKPVVLGLIFDKSATVIGQLNPLNVGTLTKQHQVLGIGYSRIGSNEVRICAYDPNIPNDILFLTFKAGNTGVNQQLDSGGSLPYGRRPVRGVMFIRSAP